MEDKGVRREGVRERERKEGWGTGEKNREEKEGARERSEEEYGEGERDIRI